MNEWNRLLLMLDKTAYSTDRERGFHVIVNTAVG
jgi:hypothetical protein